MSEMLHAQPRIIGGVDANKEDNPFQVALLMKEESNNFNAQFCGGTLIGQNFVVTAAHCSDFIDATQVEVLTGTRKLDETGDRHKVSKIHIHPNWNKSTFDNDVAVWKLETNVTNIPFPSLAKEDGLVGKEDPPAGKEDLLVSGWGVTKENGARIVDLQKVLVPLVDRKNCNDDNSYNGQITENMLCAGFNKGTQDACQGDSGGPLTRKNGKSDTLTGIVSWGYGCARPNLFGVYTRVSNANIRDFIENIINAP
jgi:secreted trypsin-like serine protease